MDGFSSAGLAGILYAEDFGETVRQAPPPPPPPPGPTQADIDAACIRAVQAAERAWEQSASERRAAALQTLAEGLAEAHATAQRQAEALSEGMARTALGMIAALLPQFCRQHGDAEVRALVAGLLPVLARTTQVVVRAHPDLLEILRDDLAMLDDGLSDRIDLRPANLVQGDVRLSWQDGGLVRETAAIRSAIQASLLQLGLIEPEHHPQDRIPAHAQ